MIGAGRAEVPQLAGDADLPQVREHVRHRPRAERDRRKRHRGGRRGLHRRHRAARGGHRQRGRHARHRADRAAREAARQVRASGSCTCSTATRPGCVRPTARRSSSTGASRPRRAARGSTWTWRSSPTGMDPADFVVTRGADEMRALIDGAQPLLRFVIDQRLDGARPRDARGAVARRSRMPCSAAGGAEGFDPRAGLRGLLAGRLLTTDRRSCSGRCARTRPATARPTHAGGGAGRKRPRRRCSR